ncbi:aminoacylase-1-like [Photinus pyralis]|uniref:aminoacylase-1-like n=1 Tax=Photinus pyralis TaxID=7054 RepID=UPI001266EF0F|nr:aminoacylase-1-like [Photinus pyralis]XP_031350145.1 aminoacylase-1-like [Photinus pyralis]XP_031350146.1 aminoacylase-1-like [Photinus pyralis]
MINNDFNFKEDEQTAIDNFREYLRIPSVHPNVNYDACVRFLQAQAESLKLPCRVYHCKPNNPIVVISCIGSEPSLKSILLNSHMDVVPVFEDKWTHKPFDAHMDERGNIFARGTQDMKSVGIQYLEAVRRLQRDNVVLRRTIHLSFVPDEERGGELGMREFVKTESFRKLNVGFALDEGLASVDDTYKVYYGERTCWRFHIHCVGTAGHASLLTENNAGDKIRHLLDRFYDFRDEEKRKLKDLRIGDVTSVNLTMLQGGVQLNVIPNELIMTVDSRIAPTRNLEEWQRTLERWCKEAGEGTFIVFDQKHPQVPVTCIDNSNPYWVAFKNVFEQLDLRMETEIFPAGTDCRYIRGVGIPAIGFSPICNTPVLLHDHDEHLNVRVFLDGINIYYRLIKSIGNC